MDYPELLANTLALFYCDRVANTGNYVPNDLKAKAGLHVGFLIKHIEELPKSVRFLLNTLYFKLSERKV